MPHYAPWKPSSIPCSTLLQVLVFFFHYLLLHVYTYLFLNVTCSTYIISLEFVFRAECHCILSDRLAWRELNTSPRSPAPSVNTNKCHLFSVSLSHLSFWSGTMFVETFLTYCWSMIYLGRVYSTIGKVILWSFFFKRKEWASQWAAFLHVLLFSVCFQVPTLSSCSALTQWWTVT